MLIIESTSNQEIQPTYQIKIHEKQLIKPINQYLYVMVYV